MEGCWNATLSSIEDNFMMMDEDDKREEVFLISLMAAGIAGPLLASVRATHGPFKDDEDMSAANSEVASCAVDLARKILKEAEGPHEENIG
jgi:hypothetical protein